MIEKDLHTVIRQGIRKPSSGLSDRVMCRIDKEKEMAVNTSRKILGLGVLCLIIFCLAFFVELPVLRFRNILVEFSPLVFPLLSALFILFEIYQLIQIFWKLRDLEKYETG